MTPRQSPNPAQMYERYLVPGIHARWAPLFLDRAGIAPGERILDLACGTGIVARTAAPRLGGEGSVVGLDVDADMLAVAREEGRAEGVAVEWRQADAASLPIREAAFDVVLCQQGLQFVADRTAVVAEMRRVLRPEGRAVASVWQGLDRHAVYQALLEAEARHLGRPVEAIATPFTLGGAEELRGLFESAFGRVEIVTESREVRFPSPERFVALTLHAAASIVPESEMDAEAREAMIRGISREIDGILQQFVEDDEVVFPMHAHIALARA